MEEERCSPGGLQRTGSLRKVLPSTPDMDTQLNMSAKMIDSRTSSPRGAHSYGPFFLEYTLLAEYNLLQKQKLPGVYVIPSAKSQLVWFGVLFIRQGIYQDGVFRFNLCIPENYPDGDCPSVVFTPPVFHPLVDPNTGQLDVQRGFGKWKRNVNHLYHVLLYTRRAFYKLDTSVPCNMEAASLLERDKDRFRFKVIECVRRSKEKLYEKSSYGDDVHHITFSEYKPETHDCVRHAMKNPKREESSGRIPNSIGLSWVKPGTLDIFSKPKS